MSQNQFIFAPYGGKKDMKLICCKPKFSRYNISVTNLQNNGVRHENACLISALKRLSKTPKSA